MFYVYTYLLFDWIELRDTFCLFDKNGDGMVTTEELGTVMMALGQRPTRVELRTMIRSVDIDSEYPLSFVESSIFTGVL